ncbi:MAG: hypothetical protein SGI77_13265 [Pirellulaceae bacterium]|nr:hypothetical protein [Pirellulaceae bacterium]
MPYVKPLAISEAPEESQSILNAIEKKFGRSFNIFSTAAYQPEVLSGITQIVDVAIVQEIKTFLNDKQLVSLAGAVALANFTNRFNHGLDIQLP